MSGSAAANTVGQIEYALAHGFGAVRLNTDRLVDLAAANDERDRANRASLALLKDGLSPLLFATLGPDDPVILKTSERAGALGINQSAIGRLIGESQGLILRTLLGKTGIGRVAVAGGDTCSHALRQLEIHSLELLMPIAPAAPLCLAFSDNPAFDKLQVASKGGQIGAPDYFVQVLKGRKSENFCRFAPWKLVQDGRPSQSQKPSDVSTSGKTPFRSHLHFNEKSQQHSAW